MVTRIATPIPISQGWYLRPAAKVIAGPLWRDGLSPVDRHCLPIVCRHLSPELAVFTKVPRLGVIFLELGNSHPNSVSSVTFYV